MKNTISMSNVVGIDIGGANIKWAVVDGSAEGQVVNASSREFALWRRRDDLVDELSSLARDVPAKSPVAVTMTGELADCFESKSEGVRFIVECVCRAFADSKVRFYQTNGQFVSSERACDQPLKTAAANWHVLANYCSRFFGNGNGLLVDVGSTTTDIVPIVDGRFTAKGLTDTQRMIHGELVYTGVVRSPVCALLRSAEIDGRSVPLAQELFATMIDAHLLVGNIPENPDENRTADGRPATRTAAMQRMARMLCADRDEIDGRVVEQMAAAAVAAQEFLIGSALQRVVGENVFGNTDEAELLEVIVSGEGSWLAQKVVAQHLPNARIRSLNDVLDTGACTAAPAVAVAMLLCESRVGAL